MADELTYYGYEAPGSQDWDYNSWMGIGDRQNDLVTGYSAALSVSARQQILGVDSPISTGQQFQFQGKTYRDDDTSPQKFANVDVFSPGGIPGTPNYSADASPLGKMSGQSLTSNSLQSSTTAAAPTPTPESDTSASDFSSRFPEGSPSTDTSDTSGQSPAQQFAKKYPQYNNVDLSTIMQKVQAIHPNIAPAQLDELWNKANSWNELAQASKAANQQYSKSFDTLKQLYEPDDGGSTGSDQ